MRFSGASVRRFPSLFDGGRESSRAATHVEFCDGVLSDAGSNPAASKLPRFARSFVGGVFRQVAPPFGLANMLDSRPFHSTYRRFARSFVGGVFRQVAAAFGLANHARLPPLPVDVPALRSVVCRRRLRASGSALRARQPCSTPAPSSRRTGASLG